MARSLEVIGERWTLLIVRDAFYGVRRFSDFRDHLDIPRAVLSERLNLLVEHGILARSAAASGRDEYALTEKGERLWPTMRSLMAWGNEYYMPGPLAPQDHPRRLRGVVGDAGYAPHAGPSRTCANSSSTPSAPSRPAATGSATSFRLRTGC